MEENKKKSEGESSDAKFSIQDGCSRKRKGKQAENADRMLIFFVIGPLEYNILYSGKRAHTNIHLFSSNNFVSVPCW